MTTSINDIENENLALVPNPARDIITIVGLEHEIERVYVFNTLGNLVFIGRDKQVQISNLSLGYYYIIIQLIEGGISTAGFIII